MWVENFIFIFSVSFFVFCLHDVGRPQPRLTWWRENTLLDDSYIAMSEKKVKNVLHLEKLERHHLHAQYTCQASNNNVTTPISSAVTLNLNRKFIFVRQHTWNSNFCEHTIFGVCPLLFSIYEPNSNHSRTRQKHIVIQISIHHFNQNKFLCLFLFY